MLALSQTERQLRSWSGLIIAVFVLSHLVNHMFAIFSLELAESVRALLAPIWHSWLGTALLYGAFLVHFISALATLYRRTTLTMPLWEGWQLGLGLLVLPLLFGHVIGTRGVHEVFDVTNVYARVSLSLWSSPGTVIKQSALVLVVWFHVAVGLHFWLRVFRWYPGLQSWLHALALLVPVLSLIGFARAGVQVAEIAAEQSRLDALIAGFGYPPSVIGQFFDNAQAGALWGYALVIGAVLLARFARLSLASRGRGFELVLPDGRQVRGATGRTVLEALRAARVPHAAVCGGRGRCTTCRVRVGPGLQDLPLPSDLESAALQRIGAPANVRLACQTRPSDILSITPLIAPDASAEDARRPGGVSGREQVVTTMFLDLRGSTALGEQRLPYDVLFILNQFFAEMALALEESNGHYAQFAGDGLMALYGLDRGERAGAQDALLGARKMLERLDGLNARLGAELATPLRVGIGIHTGEAIVGTMGPPTSPNYSAIGDNINIAARLEAKTKELGCAVIVSAQALSHAGAAPSDYVQHEVDVWGREGLIAVVAFTDAHALPLPAA